MTVALEALRGRSPGIEAIRKQVAQLLARQTSGRHLPAILILGETGTGKGLLARAFHEAGPRRNHLFVDINCAAIPETLLEAELFGYERGAFTDARHAKPGLFQTAHGGTLFLDEIGLLPASLQSKLLTVLEDHRVRRLGGTRAEPVDVALVAATSLDLRRAVADRVFREDLYHRVAVITLELPPLRARGKDILILADHFLARACADYGLPSRLLTPDARDALMAHRWPGNVRELANAMERGALLSDRNEITGAMLDFLPPDDAVDPAEAGNIADAGSLEGTLRARIEAALRASRGNIRRTAAALGISRNTLRARMDKYGLRHHDLMRPRTLRPVPGSAPTVAPAALPQWERRHLSFLRVKVLESLTIDVGRALEVVGEKVRTFGGRIEEASPTGIIAVFGLEPVDNAPSHAALAALAIQNAAARAHTAGRAGGVVSAIHCADHLVAHHDSAPAIGVDGKDATWSILERMVAAAASGAVVVSRQVVPFLVRRFALDREHGDLDVWLVLRVEKAAAGWSATRFVGRSAELNALRRAASLAEQRHGQVVGVVGEAGVGKSRLVYEAVQPLKDWLVLASAGAPFMKDTPFFPVAELLKSLCRIEDMDTPSEVRPRVTRALPGDADRSVLAPILDLLRGLPIEDAFHNVDAEQRRKRTHDALRQMFLAASRAQPLCLIVEDLQWIDSETQQVLDNLVGCITGSRVLLLVNYRPEYQHPWGSKTYYSQLRLDALPVESASELLDVLLGPDTGLAPLKQLLVKRGNPFFLEETVRMLVETKMLAGERGRYRLTQPIRAIQIPPTVQAVLAARIDRLPPENKRLLQVASVVGKDVPFTLLQAIADLPDEALRRGLDHLRGNEFLYETGLFPDLEYTFKHALTHEVTYRGLLHERRRDLHARIVDAIETVHRERLGEQVERLAHHALRGEIREKAVHYLREAGRKAAARSALQEARAWFDQALETLELLPQVRSTLEQAFEIRLDLRPVLIQLGEARRALGSLHEAEALAERLNDDRRRSRVRAYMANCHSLLGELDEALAAATLARAIARAVGELDLRILATTCLEQAEYFRGDYEHVVELALDNISAVPADRLREYFGSIAPAAVYDRYWLILSLAPLGRFAEAARYEAEAASLAASTQHRYSVGVVHLAAATIHVLKGDWVAAKSRIANGIALFRTGGIGLLLPRLVACSAWALAQLGEKNEALSQLQEAQQLVERQAARGLVGMTAVPSEAMGRAYLLLGHVDEARRLANRAIESSPLRHGTAPALHLLGDVATHARQFDAELGETHYREALSLAEPSGMRPLAANCHLGLGKLYRRTGQREQAHEHLTTATTMYREMGMTYWLEQAEAEMIELA
jgi:transcriptional regulator with AAA-type ATPase domain/tetratricopeptide (TPR) repeat protein